MEKGKKNGNKTTFNEHRENLRNNPHAYTDDFNKNGYGRLRKALKKTLQKMGYTNLDLKNTSNKSLIDEFIDKVFELQGEKPFYYIELSGNNLPTCWNRPKEWNLNYIKYEWGHLKSREQHEQEAEDIKNLSLQSGRCNNQLQSSLDAEELCVYGGKLEERIRTLLDKFKDFYDSDEGRKLVAKFEAKR